ncbi:carboxypeptidase-like regulatory domain-containing protein [Mangrovivirga cuniculi]|uniref:Uncharacterized protein n=1 Tax=Mangrovivirga cuniculi TaxID=2715131 RepID=A0A4D7JQA3_9BACT|nr:carboxypeptidase-like regulatory domain-containing protein [Mangrovivirga cuniculi]QCK16837.1 hypothetical protein DCC35_19905 [Mangrovivirga cuniculi]
MHNIFYSLILFVLCASNIWSQVKIKGSVIDGKYPIPGVNVIEKGQNNGSTTNIDGEFTIIVSDTNSTLIFQSIGYEYKEIGLEGKTEVQIILKPQCERDWFDAQSFEIYAVSGLLNTPVGGQLKFSFPVFFSQTTLWTGIRYQTDFDRNNLLNGEIGIHHLFVTCNFDADIISNYRKFSLEGENEVESISIEPNLNFKKFKFIIGYGMINYNGTETNNSQNSTGPIFGLGTWIGRPFNLSLVAKASIYKNITEYNGEIRRQFKRIETFGRFYKLETITEFSLGIGYNFTYRFKKQKID